MVSTMPEVLAVKCQTIAVSTGPESLTIGGA